MLYSQDNERSYKMFPYPKRENVNQLRQLEPYEIIKNVGDDLTNILLSYKDFSSKNRKSYSPHNQFQIPQQKTFDKYTSNTFSIVFYRGTTFLHG